MNGSKVKQAMTCFAPASDLAERFWRRDPPAMQVVPEVLHAQPWHDADGVDMIADLASAGGDTITAMRQAAKLGLTQLRQTVAAPVMFLTGIRNPGLQAAGA
jgi:hypothetical protein